MLRGPAAPRSGRTRAHSLAVGALCALVACAPEISGLTTPSDPVSASRPAPPRPQTTLATATPAPDTIQRYFQTLESRRLADGLMRQDRRPADLPITARILEDGFVRIALYEEYDFVDGRIVERKTPSVLRRWDAPVRMRLEFGASVPEATRAEDRQFVTGYARRLSQLTRQPVSMVQGGANFHVLVLSETERRAIGPRLEQLVAGIDRTTVDLITDLPLGISCLVLAFSRRGANVYTDAIAIIRAELPDLSRRACYHEELAQGMGLPNDSPRVRPSLFNDTSEFAVLTELDELMLRMLYDPRLRPGIREAEARPIIRQIAAELMGAAS